MLQCRKRGRGEVLTLRQLNRGILPPNLRGAEKMSEIVGDLSTWQGWQWIAFAGVLGLAIVLAVVNHRCAGRTGI